MRCFVICGPESAGNRLMGAILKMAEVKGSPSTSQPSFPLLTGHDEFWIVHHPQAEQLIAIQDHGYDVVMLICVRETHALIQSALDRGHADSTWEAQAKIRKAIVENVGKAAVLELPFEIVSYEGWTKGSMVEFFKRHELRQVRDHLKMVGQIGVSGPYYDNQNEKHYAVR